ncbi:MAG: hypothetical protein REI78_15055 [Pedobacter sp.]|nr:hypothetical protein [Pedobacter sp.]MDQ8054348.1 hypothetical protein [Pedobacter sp.]
MKKNHYLFWILLFVGFSANAQQAKNSHYVIPEFTEATVKFKTGPDLKVRLNYNTVTEEMVYYQNGQTMAIAETSKIDTVYLGGHKFVPANDVFYEVIKVKQMDLYIRPLSKALMPNSNAGINISQTSAQTATNKVRTETILDSLNLPNYKIINKSEFYLKKDGNFVRIEHINSLVNLYPEQSKEIRQYARANHLDFAQVADVKKILAHIQD